VLFVEDDPQTRESMVQSLFLNGFRVLAAESAFRGLRVLAQEQYRRVVQRARAPNRCGTARVDVGSVRFSRNAMLSEVFR
jgi:response regulator RpfG family c-di-GMP phosphodiesterase